jgi:hypothetical protein
MKVKKEKERDMKKFIAILAAAILVLSFGTLSAFAAGELPSGEEIKYRVVNGDTTTDTDAETDIPVYGYVGELAKVVPPEEGSGDDEDPEVPPDYQTYAVNVSVPVKIIWAAFEPDGGDITAPEYYIRNNSTVNKLDVTLKSFTKTTESGFDNDEIDPYLTLNIVAKSSPFAYAGVVTNDGTGTAGTATYIPTNAEKFGTRLDKQTKWNFTLGGNFDGDFTSDAKETRYDMTLLFAVNNA